MLHFLCHCLQQQLLTIEVFESKFQRNSLKNLRRLGTNTSIFFLGPSCGECTWSISNFPMLHGSMITINCLTLVKLYSDQLQKIQCFSPYIGSPINPNARLALLLLLRLSAESEAIEKGKMLKTAISDILGMPGQTAILIDSKDLYSSFSTRRNSISRSIRAEVNVISFEFEVKNVDVMCWIPRSLSLADPGTKTESPLTQWVQLLMHTA